MGIKHVVARMGKMVYKYKPEILLGTGFVAVTGGIILSCNASRKLDKILEDSADRIDKIRSEKTGVEAEKAVNKEKMICAATLGKNFAPGAFLIGLGYVFIGKSHADLREDLSKIGLALNNSVAAMTFYRGNVRKRFGDDVDRQMMYGTEPMEYTEMEYTDEEGMHHPEQKRTVEVGGDENPPVPISFVFGPDNPNWRGNVEQNLAFLYFVEQNVNADAAKMHAGFNDMIGKYLGDPNQITGIHRITGKMLTPEECIKAEKFDKTTGDYPIHLGIEQAYKYRELERSNARDVEYILVPNMQDYIIEEYDAFKRKHNKRLKR